MRVLVRLVLIVIVPFLAACGSNFVEQPTAESSTDSESNPSDRGIYLESGEFIEFGSFNKYAVDLFDPCQNLPIEALEAAGFPTGERPESMDNVYGPQCIHIPFEIQEGEPSLTVLTTSSIGEEAIEANGLIVAHNVSPKYSEIFTYNLYRNHNKSECGAGIDTKRGGLQVEFDALEHQMAFEDLCERAATALGI